LPERARFADLYFVVKRCSDSTRHFLLDGWLAGYRISIRERVGGADGEIFLHIRNDVRNTAMPPFAGLSTDQIWQVVAYKD